jgi:hypothetical protein
MGGIWIFADREHLRSAGSLEQLRFTKVESITRTLKLQQECPFLARPMGFARNLRQTMTQALLIIIPLVTLADATEFNRSCNPRAIATAEINIKPIMPVTFQNVGKGYRSGVHAPLQIAARSQSEWTALWSQHAWVDSSSQQPPVIDFEKEIVIGLFLGDKPTGGYDVQISRVERRNDALTIYYQEKSPLPGAMVTQALTQPFHIVRIIGEVESVVIFRRAS